MEILFKSKKLRKECTTERLLVRKFGKEQAEKITQRLIGLKSANSLKDISSIPSYRLHELKGSRKGQFSIDLRQPFRLIFEPVSELSFEQRKELDKVHAVRILSVEDTHENKHRK